MTGINKGGTGLDDVSLDMLILTVSVQDVRQCEGRIRTTNNIVYDVVDNFPTLEKHWNKREEWYISRGATIVKDEDPHMNVTHNSKSNITTKKFLPSVK